MEIVAGINPRMQLRDVREYARRVESLGFDTLHIPEMVHDPFVMSSLALEATSSLHVRTGVALAFVRSPMLSALSAWDLARLSEGRFDLGLGTQVRKNIEERYGMPFDNPVNRLSEYIGVVKACFNSFGQRECIPFHGEFYNLSRLQDEFIPESLGGVRVPEIWLGAVGPRLSKLAAEQCDGLITHPTNSHSLHLRENIIPLIDSTLGVNLKRIFPVIAAPLTVVTDAAEERERLIDEKKRMLAFLYSTPAYAPTLDLLGFRDLGVDLRKRFSAGEGKDSYRLIPGELFHQVVIACSFDGLADEVHERFGGLVSGVTLRPPVDTKCDDAFRLAIEALKGK
jgi:probable F420-dependent oxidoreductase